MENIEEKAKELIQSELNITLGQSVEEEEFLKLISDKVLYYMENDIDLLFSYLYRLDINEQNVNQAMGPEQTELPHIALARLIYKRQLERSKTKMIYKQQSIDGWEQW
jgi:hypothetical protein